MTLENSKKANLSEEIGQLHKLAVEKHKEGDIVESVSLYQQAIDLDKEQPTWVYGNIITLLSQLGRTEQAIQIGELAYQQYPNAEEIVRSLGIALHNQGDIDNSLKKYQQAIAINPKQPPWLYSHLVEGFIAQGLVEKAIDFGSKGIELYPDSEWINYHLAEALAAQGKWEQAIAIYEKARPLENHNVKIENKIKYAIGKRIASDEKQALNYYLLAIQNNPKDLENYLKVLDIQPDNVSIFNYLINVIFTDEKINQNGTDFLTNHLPLSAIENLGQILLDQQAWQRISNFYQLALELYPNSSELNYNYAQYLALQHQWEKAITFYQKVTQINPNHWQAYNHWGDCLLNQKKWEDAVDVYEQTIALKPDYPWINYNLATALYHIGNQEEAILYYDKIDALEPDFWSKNKVNFFLQHELGDLLLKTNRAKESISLYRRAIKLNPQFHWSYINLGIALAKLNRGQESIAVYQQLIQKFENNYDAHYFLGIAITISQGWEAIIKCHNQFLVSNVNDDGNNELKILDDWQNYFDQGNQLQIENKLNEAACSYFQAIVRNPDNSWIYHSLGDTHLKLGKWEEAISSYEQAVKFNKDYFWSNYNLGVAYTNAGQWHQAINLYKNSIKLNPGLNLIYRALKEALNKQWDKRTSKVDSLLHENKLEEALDIYSNAIAEYKEHLHLPTISQPKPIPEKVSVLLIVDDFLSQCLRYRVQQKIEQLEHAGFTTEYVPWRDIAKAKNKLHFYHVVIFYRVPAFPDIIETIEYAKAIKKVVFYEIDDLIFDENKYPDPFESYGGQISLEEYHGLIKGTILFREAMAMCDYGISSTPALVSEMQPIAKKQVCFLHRNALDKFNYDFTALNLPKIERTYTSIFYGSGTKAHNSDFNELVAPALAKIMEIYPQVRLTLMGYLTLPEMLEPYKERVDRIELVKEVTLYWEFLKQADINIAVLHPTSMNNCKSELKWFEAASMGVPSVVSGTQTYTEILNHKVDALIANNTEEWFINLELLINDATLRHNIAQKAYERVWQEYSIPSMAENIKNIVSQGIQSAIEQGIIAPRSTKKKLLIVNVFYPPQSIGGATRIVKDNVDILKANYSDEYEISVFTTDNDNPNVYEILEYEHEGIHVTKVSSPMMVGMDWQYENPKMYEIFTKYLEFNQPDLIHFHCIQRLTASVLEAAGDLNIPYIVTVHDAWWISDNQFLVNEQGIECNYQQNDPIVTASDIPGFTDISSSLLRKRYLKQCLDKASAVLAVSEMFTELYRSNGITQTQSNRNGIMPKPRLPRKPSPSQKVRLAHIGGMAAHKGYFLLKEAVELAQLSNCEVIVVSHAQVTGSVSHEQWGTTPVTFIAKVPQEKVYELYSNIDILVAPSMWPESFGLVTREAAAAGVWVIASDKGALAEDLVQGVNGDVFNPDNIEELIDILQRIDREPHKYQQLILKDIPIRTTEQQVSELKNIYDFIFKSIETS